MNAGLSKVSLHTGRDSDAGGYVSRRKAFTSIGIVIRRRTAYFPHGGFVARRIRSRSPIRGNGGGSRIWVFTAATSRGGLRRFFHQDDVAVPLLLPPSLLEPSSSSSSNGKVCRQPFLSSPQRHLFHLVLLRSTHRSARTCMFPFAASGQPWRGVAGLSTIYDNVIPR